jgi:hypothetical protein
MATIKDEPAEAKVGSMKEVARVSGGFLSITEYFSTR